MPIDPSYTCKLLQTSELQTFVPVTGNPRKLIVPAKPMKSVDGEVKAVKTTDPTFYKLASLLFTREGREIKWDIYDGLDEVIVIIFNQTRNTLVCTKQFRPGLYYNTVPDYDKKIDVPIDTKKYPLSNGVAIEFCTGFANTNKSLEEVAVHSLRDDCGYEVNESNLKKVATTKSGGSKQTFFFANVTDEMKIPFNKQNIEVIEYTIPQIKDNIAQPVVFNGPSSFIFGLMWFLFNKNSLNC